MQGHYMMYHNPERMEEDCEEAQMYERVATAKQGIANQLAAENGIIWCVGRKWDDDAFYLYQRIDGAYPEPGDAEFPVHLVARHSLKRVKWLISRKTLLQGCLQASALWSSAY
ncbi:hypothetical protein D3875_20225 [Deinococcus cavernae]|uniref:Uncharacterized protein n=1 Tax=Deinococcus cavernae TaxID=2320857 RepID=A0A418V259_9DEIO|nr:hypothetical protein [Deinococcus cavernae]RJF70021.1 hypothetical protein D3875_20225 [Deinococcus cavernae]